MTNPSKFSFGVSIEPSWGQNYGIGLAKHAERLGFSTVWVPDGGPSPPFSDCLVTLSAIAATTSKIRYGSAILNFYTRNPALIASSFLALSDLGAKGKSRFVQRAVLGLGLGSSWNVSKFGISRRKGMIDNLREAAESIRELFDGKEVTAKTDAFNIESVVLSKSKGKIPIHIGTGSPKGLTLAGEIADGVILTNRIPSEVEESMKHITLGLGISSRRRTDLEVTNSVVISVDRSRERAKRAAKVTCAYLVSWLDDVIAEIHGLDMDAKRKISNFIRQGDEKSAGKLVDDRMLDLLTVTGTVEECVERCREHLSYGIDQIAFCDPLGPKPENSLELIAKKIIPRL